MSWRMRIGFYLSRFSLWRFRLWLIDRRLKKLEPMIQEAGNIMEEMSGPLEEAEFSKEAGEEHWCDVSEQSRKHNEAGEVMRKCMNEKAFLQAKSTYLLGYR